MKDDLVGRVVGFETDHEPHPVHCKPGRVRRRKRTIWGRVFATSAWEGHVLLNDLTGKMHGVPVSALHTIMPESY